jgi:PAS domain S-box-containing protein
MRRFFDYSLEGSKSRSGLKPQRSHLIILIIGVVASYFVIINFYVEKQLQLTYQMTRVSMNYASSLIHELGPLHLEEDKLYAGDSALFRSEGLVDSVQRATGFGCTIFANDKRIATTVFTHDSLQRVIGTRATPEIAEMVLGAGRSYYGTAVSLGRKWIVGFEPLREKSGRIVGMLSIFEEESTFNSGVNRFKLFLAVTLLTLAFLIILTVELAVRWSRLIENQHFVLTEKNKQLKEASEELIEMNEHLKLSEKRFRDFFESSHDLIQNVDMNDSFLYVNSSWLRTLGYLESEALELKVTDVVHPDYLDQFNELTEKVKKGEGILGADMVFLTKERDAILLNGNMQCEFRDGKPFVITGVFRNDTTRKLAQQRMQESEKQYRFLVEAADDLIFKTDYKGHFTYVNGIVEQLTGYTTEEFLSQNYMDLVKGEHRQQVEQFYASQFSRRQEVSYFEFEITKKNGEDIWIGQNVKAIFKGDDRNWIEGYLVVARDITDRKHKEERIHLQNKLLEEQNRSIKQSIRYAKRIQDSILPNEAELTDLFPQSFVYYQPKDIVSGDFYWISKRDDNLFVAVADCTGHGVPAAFMSIIGSNQLNNAINRKRLDNPVDILNDISKGFQRVLKRPTDDMEIQDGMDIALCCYNTKTKLLRFTGAFNDLYHIRDKELTKYKGTRISVGVDEKIYKMEKYKLHEFKVKKNDMIYMFSDGYADQFGGQEGRKLGYERFRNILKSVCDEPMTTQKRLLEESMAEWRISEEQIDDICVLGVRF